MQKFRIRVLIAFFLALTPGFLSSICNADDLPDYMDVIVGMGTAPSPAQVAEQNVLDLDLAMFGIYDTAQAKFQKNFLAQHPVIMALFSNQGGKLTLYRPGKPPVEPPQVPLPYQAY